MYYVHLSCEALPGTIGGSAVWKTRRPSLRWGERPHLGVYTYGRSFTFLKKDAQVAAIEENNDNDNSEQVSQVLV